jgi:hypothetical protein
MNLITTPTGRKAFLANPEQALTGEGADVSAMSPDLLATLTELDKSELILLARVNAALLEAGLTSNDQGTLGYL